MTRTMADGIGANAGLVLELGTDLVGAYLTGTGGVPWSASDLAIAGPRLVGIDQGAGASPNYSATVQDVETGAYAAGDVPGWQARCTQPRPTVYCNRVTLPKVLATGWTGNLWLAYPGWLLGQPLPPAPGCSYMAVQNGLAVGGTHDVSVVLDPTWPAGGTMPAIGLTGLNAMRVDEAVALVTAAGFTPGPVTLLGIAGQRSPSTLDPSLYSQHLVAGASLSGGQVLIGAA